MAAKKKAVARYSAHWLHELEDILKRHGYDPKDAKAIADEGMGPEELAHRIRTTIPGGVGSLEWTHRMRKASLRKHGGGGANVGPHYSAAAQKTNKSGLTYREWVEAAGHSMTGAMAGWWYSHQPTIKAWSADEDPATYRSKASHGGGGARTKKPTRLEELQANLPKGWTVRTYSPGDGVTRYRFFHDAPNSSYFGPASGAYTALGMKEAEAFASGLAH